MIYSWTDRFERAYATLRDEAGHWRVEWGARTPPGSDTYVRRGQRVTSDRNEAVRVMIDWIHRTAGDAVAAQQAEETLWASLRRRSA